MQMPKAGPGDGPKKTCDHFHHWKGIEGGQAHHAYVAGDAHWIIGHPSDKGSKPCLLWATQNALPCRFCALGKIPCHLGYLPVYRATDIKPLFIVVYGEEREWVELCDLHDRVKIGRETGKGARLFVRKMLDQKPEFQTTLSYRKCKQDVEPSLLVTWGIPELVAFLRCAVSDNALSLTKEVPVKSDGQPFSPMYEAAAEKYGKAGDGAMLGGTDAAVNRLVEHAKKSGGKPSKNGTHASE